MTRSGWMRWLGGGRLALLLSLAVHAALVLALASLAIRQRRERPPDPPQLDVVALAADEPPAPALVARPRLSQKMPVTMPTLRKQPALPPQARIRQATANSGFHADAGTAPGQHERPSLFATESGGNEPRGTGSRPGGGRMAPGEPGTLVPGGRSPGTDVPGSPENASGTTAFFQVTAHGRTIVYVIDRSASMGPSGGLETARRELLASLARLPDSVRFQVIVYNRSAEALCGAGRTGLVAATDENKRQAALLLKDLPAEGGTDHLPALRRALSLQPDDIFFLTDADDLTDAQVQAITAINQRQNGGRTAIHTIELNTANRDRDDMPLHVLARANHGSYQAVSLASGQ